jgi:hypothetical protein
LRKRYRHTAAGSRRQIQEAKLAPVSMLEMSLGWGESERGGGGVEQRKRLHRRTANGGGGGAPDMPAYHGSTIGNRSLPGSMSHGLAIQKEPIWPADIRSPKSLLELYLAISQPEYQEKA